MSHPRFGFFSSMKDFAQDFTSAALLDSCVRAGLLTVAVATDNASLLAFAFNYPPLISSAVAARHIDILAMQAAGAGFEEAASQPADLTQVVVDNHEGRSTVYSPAAFVQTHPHDKTKPRRYEVTIWDENGKVRFNSGPQDIVEEVVSQASVSIRPH